MESNIAGCKALFARVIIDAFKEAILSRTPIPVEREVIEKRKKKNRKLRNLFIFSVKNYIHAGDNRLKFTIVILEMLKSIYRILDRDCIKKNEKAYNARIFLDHRNSDFVFYCTHIGIDPVDASERINKQIKLFDDGNKNIYSKLKSTFDLPLTVFSN